MSYNIKSDFSSIMTCLKNQISESNQMSQPEFLYEKHIFPIQSYYEEMGSHRTVFTHAGCPFLFHFHVSPKNRKFMLVLFHM